MAGTKVLTKTGNEVQQDLNEGPLDNDPRSEIVWDEISTSVVGSNIFTVVGRIDYDYDELEIAYSTTARYPNEFVGNVAQFRHRRKDLSEIRPHIHWKQNSAGNPNILVAYRSHNNGETIPTTWTLKALTSSDNKFTYVSPGLAQITEFNLPAAVGESIGLSGTFECKIYRDSLNTSGLFSGADSYSGDFQLKYYDIHYQIDQDGSRQEFTK